MTKTATGRRVAHGVGDNDAFRLLVRVGYGANGLLHVLIGLLALQVAFGKNASADQAGAFGAIASTPGGVILLWVIVVGTAALALFQLIELILVRGGTREAWAERIKFLGKAIVYAAIGIFAATVAMRGSAGAGDGTKSVSARLLALPGGVALLLLAGVVVAGIGIYLIVKGARQKFLADLTRPDGRLRQVTTILGTTGYVAKGLAILIIGVFVGFAALTSDPSKAEGLDGALTSLTELPFGQVLLAAVAAGLVLFGLYCFVRARYAKL